jgi:23S rRNA (cytidine2498-2'-O)-methyltransferase
VVIFTCAPDAQREALADLRFVDSAAELNGWLDPGIGLLRPGTLAFDALGAQLLASAAPFVRHLAPVSRTLRLSANADDADAMRDLISGMLAGLRPQASFAVQVRFAGKRRQMLDAASLSRVLDEPLLDAGFVRDVRDPAQIISVLCRDDMAYLGASDAAHNLSNWAGGAQRFREEPEMISRAEFKLLELLSIFRIALPAKGLALDLGASPGGWTRVLRQRGMSVVAVDPAELHASLQRDRGVRHVRRLAQPFLQTARDAQGRPDERYDIVVNDMRMDAIESAQVMCDAAEVLMPNGLAIMTLKLPARGAWSVARRALDALGARYALLGARQLHHNRSEVTAIGRLR